MDGIVDFLHEEIEWRGRKVYGHETNAAKAASGMASPAAVTPRIGSEAQPPIRQTMQVSMQSHASIFLVPRFSPTLRLPATQRLSALFLP